MKKIIKKIKNKIKLIKRYFYFFIDYNTHRKRIILLNTPEHGNLGDQALVLAEYKFFEKYFPEYHICEIYGNMWNKYFFKNVVRRNDIVMVHAGGFLGDLWPYEEKRTFEMLNTFKYNPKVILPQTIFYKDTPEKKKLLDSAKKFYNTYSDLLIFTREKGSYELFQKEILDKSLDRCKLVPDIALFLKGYNEENKKRDGVLCCFRSDLECIMDENSKETIQRILGGKNVRYSYTDTVVPYSIKPKQREYEVQKKLREFAESKLVITDRLHGMIFATITSTPCIAVNNLSRKVEGVYEWIKELPYIKCVDKITEKDISEMMKLSNCKYDNSSLEYCFDEMAESIKKIMS